jgi:Arc/MetJ family transcription regulator
MSSRTNLRGGFPVFSQPNRPTARAMPARPAVEPLEGRTLLSAVLPGATVATPGTTVAADPALAGTIVHDTNVPFTIVVGGKTVFKGNLEDRVVKETATGTLDFSQSILSDAGFSAVALLHYETRAGFGGVTTDVNFRTDGPGAPSDHPVSASRTPTGKTISFDFAEAAVDPKTQSLFYFVKTNATQYNLLGSTTIGMQQSAAAPFGSVTLTTAEPIAPPTPHLPTALIDDLTRMAAGFNQADNDVINHAPPKQLFSDVAAVQGVVSNLAFDVLGFTKAPLANVEPPLTSFLGDLLTFYAAEGRGDAATVSAATAKGTADLEALLTAAVDPQHTNVAQLQKDAAVAAQAIAALAAALLSGKSTAVNTAFTAATASLPAIIVDLVGGEPGGLVG